MKRIGSFRRVLAICGILILGAGGFLVWQNTFRLETSSRAAPEVKSHLVGNTERSIAKIRIKAFYVVPKDKADEPYEFWRARVAQTLEDAAAFHTLQFRGASTLTFDIFPEPLILEQRAEFYDTDRSDFGNPRGLLAIGEEVEKRVFLPDGDLFGGTFAKFDEGEYPVAAFFYEGVGAAGGIIHESGLESVSDIARELGLPQSVIYKVAINSFDGFALLNRKYISDEAEPGIGSSLFYHEFAHTIGAADRYDAATDAPLSGDIMGSGRRRPIRATYLDREVLKEMGVITRSLTQ